MARNQYRQADGCDRENDGCPSGHFGENIDGSSGAKGRLRALPTKRASQVRAGTRLQQDNPDKDKTNKDMKSGKKINHWVTFE